MSKSSPTSSTIAKTTKTRLLEEDHQTGFTGSGDGTLSSVAKTRTKTRLLEEDRHQTVLSNHCRRRNPPDKPPPTTTTKFINPRFYGLNRTQFDERYDRIVVREKTIQQKLKTASVYDRSRISRNLNRIFPFVEMLKNYSFKNYLVGDLIAGLTIAFMAVPQSLGYTRLSTAPEILGLYTSFFPVVIYFFFSTCRHVSLGSMALNCLIVGSAIQRLPASSFAKTAGLVEGLIGGGVVVTNVTSSYYTSTLRSIPIDATPPLTTSLLLDTIEKNMAATVAVEDTSTSLSSTTTMSEDEVKILVTVSVSCLAGIFLTLMSFFRLGFLVCFMSDSFVAGYLSGSLTRVFTFQIKDILGLKPGKYKGFGEYFYTLLDIIKQVPQCNLVQLAISLCALALLVGVKFLVNPRLQARFRIPIPIEIIVIGGSVIGVHFMGLEEKYDVSVMSNIRSGFPRPMLPSLAYMVDFAYEAFLMAIIAYLLVAMMLKVFSQRHGYRVDSDQELLALGLSCIGGSFFQALAPSTSPSRCFLMESCGGKTRMTHVFTALFVLLTMLILAPYFRSLPICVLACIIIIACVPLFPHFIAWHGYYRTNMCDFWIWQVTFWANLFLAVDTGMLVGITFSALAVHVIFAKGPKPELLVPHPQDGILIEPRRYKKIYDDLPSKDDSFFEEGRGGVTLVSMDTTATILKGVAVSMDTKAAISKGIGLKDAAVVSVDTNTAISKGLSSKEAAVSTDTNAPISKYRASSSAAEGNNYHLLSKKAGHPHSGVVGDGDRDLLIFRFRSAIFFITVERFKKELFSAVGSPEKFKRASVGSSSSLFLSNDRHNKGGSRLNKKKTSPPLPSSTMMMIEKVEVGEGEGGEEGVDGKKEDVIIDLTEVGGRGDNGGVVRLKKQGEEMEEKKKKGEGKVERGGKEEEEKGKKKGEEESSMNVLKNRRSSELGNRAIEEEVENLTVRKNWNHSSDNLLEPLICKTNNKDNVNNNNDNRGSTNLQNNNNNNRGSTNLQNNNNDNRGSTNLQNNNNNNNNNNNRGSTNLQNNNNNDNRGSTNLRNNNNNKSGTPITGTSSNWSSPGTNNNNNNIETIVTVANKLHSGTTDINVGGTGTDIILGRGSGTGTDINALGEGGESAGTTLLSKRFEQAACSAEAEMMANMKRAMILLKRIRTESMKSSLLGEVIMDEDFLMDGEIETTELGRSEGLDGEEGSGLDRGEEEENDYHHHHYYHHYGYREAGRTGTFRRDGLSSSSRDEDIINITTADEDDKEGGISGLENATTTMLMAGEWNERIDDGYRELSPSLETDYNVAATTVAKNFLLLREQQRFRTKKMSMMVMTKEKDNNNKNSEFRTQSDVHPLSYSRRQNSSSSGGHLPSYLAGRKKIIVLDCSSVSYLDLSGATVLASLKAEYNLAGVGFVLAECPEQLVEQMSRVDVCRDFFLSNALYPSVYDAIKSFY